MMDEVKQYSERDPWELDKNGGHYVRHVSAMTKEGLHSKGDIAAELGWRDMHIEKLQQQVNQLAAELSQIKSGPQGFFSYDSDSGFEEHATADEAMKAADAAIDYYRGDACDGWSEEVERVCWGVIMQKSTEVGKREIQPDDKVSPHCSHWCDFALLPAEKTPQTDAFLLNVQADGVDKFGKYISLFRSDSNLHALAFAASLRAQATALQQKGEKS